MNPFVPIAALAVPVTIALLRAGKAKAAAVTAPTAPGAPPAPAEQEASMHAREAVQEIEKHDAAAQAKQQAEAEAAELAAIAERARVVSEQALADQQAAAAAQEQARQAEAAAKAAAAQAQTAQDVAAAQAQAQAAQQQQQLAAAAAAKKKAEAEQAAATKAEAERKKAAAEAKAAEQERLRAEAEAKARAEKQAAQDAARQALAQKQQQQQQAQARLQTAAQALAKYLAKPGADFGRKNAPSEPVLIFQEIAEQAGWPNVDKDGIVGKQTRAIAKSVGVTLPARRQEATKPAPVPEGKTVAAPAEPPPEQLVVTKPVVIQTPTGLQQAQVPVVAPPPGFDPALAKTLAHDVTRHLVAVSKKHGAKARFNYDRNMLERFQTAAALKPDRLYGGASRGALLYYYPGGNPPQPYFDPKATIQYKPPGGQAAA